MQILPTNSGSWINPATLTQQGASDARAANASGANRGGVDATTPLEQSTKAGDRDADQRYDGPSDSGSQSNTNTHEDQSPSSILNLPALDDQPPSTLDLMG